MIFTLELRGEGKRFRYQNSKKWRTVRDPFILENDDFRTDDPLFFRDFSTTDMKITLEGEDYIVDATSIAFGKDRVLGSTSTVLRSTFPDLPTIEQLRRTIEFGDDSQDNSLILNVFGGFELRNASKFDFSHNDPTIIFRNETYSACNNYVGAKAALDDSHINNIYRTSLVYWLKHLQEGGTKFYSLSEENESLDSVLEELEEIEKNWVSQY